MYVQPKIVSLFAVAVAYLVKWSKTVPTFWTWNVCFFLMKSVYKLIDLDKQLLQVNCAGVTHWKQVNSSDTLLDKVETSNGLIVQDIVKCY